MTLQSERLAKECLALAKKYRDEKERNERLTETLKFYADPDHWPRGTVTCHNDMQLRIILEDRGDLAREVLGEN